MNSNIYNRIKIFCKKKKLILCGDGIVVGVSGGADSVFLLEFLLELKEELGLKLCAVHVNHGIRGEAANRDEKMVEELVEKKGVPYRSFHADIPKMAEERHCSEEEMGRVFRYECFEKVRRELGFSKIAVAHHMDDQAETVLFQLTRGSALRGLCGMMPQNGYVIRPMLVVSRAEIEEELSRLGMPYQQDLTNFDETYSRNRLRHNVLPYLEEHIQPETVSHIARTAEYMQEIRGYIDRQVGRLFDEIVVCGDGRVETSAKRFCMEDIVLQRECLFIMMEKVCGRRKDLTGKHVEQLISLINGETGKRISLPYGMNAGKDYDVFWIICREKAILSSLSDDGERQLSEETELAFPICDSDGHLILEGDDFHRITWERKCVAKPPVFMEKNSCTKWFDYGKIKNALVFRKPRQGDYLWISPDGGRKKLSRLLIDRKIPPSERNKLWVLAEGAHILWVPCLNRGSAYYYVGEGTMEVLLINEEGKDT